MGRGVDFERRGGRGGTRGLGALAEDVQEREQEREREQGEQQAPLPRPALAAGEVEVARGGELLRQVSHGVEFAGRERNPPHPLLSGWR